VGFEEGEGVYAGAGVGVRVFFMIMNGFELWEL
jgi:hypothetical protein